MKFKLVEEIPERKFKYYNDGQVTKRFKIGDPIPDGWVEGHLGLKGRSSWNKGLTAETDTRVKANGQATRETRLANNNYNAWNKGLTKDTDSRIKGHPGESNGMYAKHPEAWNKGLTASTDERMKKASVNHKGCKAWNKGLNIEGHPHSEEAKEKIRQAHLDPEFQERRYQQMKKNGTLFVHNSKAEEEAYANLCSIYGAENIKRQYFDRSRYPFKCDFYIIPEDKFIEIHANWTHGRKPYNPEDPECQKQLADWIEKSKTSSYYRIAIYTWTDLDVRKLETAKKNNLNFEAIY